MSDLACSLFKCTVMIHFQPLSKSAAHLISTCQMLGDLCKMLQHLSINPVKDFSVTLCCTDSKSNCCWPAFFPPARRISHKASPQGYHVVQHILPSIAALPGHVQAVPCNHHL